MFQRLNKWKNKIKFESLFELEKNAVYEESVNIPVRIKRGMFKGVVYCYGKVKIQEDPERNTAKMHFEYIPIKNEELIQKNTTKFIKLAGDILTHLIQTEKIPLETKNASDASERILDPMIDDME